MLRLFIRFFLPLSPEQLINALVEESALRLVQPCNLLKQVENKEVFNLIYDTEIKDIYANETTFGNLISQLQTLCNSSMTDVSSCVHCQQAN